ncbi:MAG: phenylalanine--tRNA ligase subunit alpha [Clostridiales bacterium]|nr:phenylalanine--tRNA ligase subunit alpha [Clostridiales bacterium]
MQEKLREIQKNAKKQLENVKNQEELEKLRIELFSKKGALTAIMREMGAVAPEDRPKMGALANTVREELEGEFAQIKQKLNATAQEAKIIAEKIDVTMPGARRPLGKIHPLKQVERELCDIFLAMGFTVVSGPEVERDYYNFTALNIPENHPARDDHDTFYITDEILLRTQTSPVQIRVMEQKKLPIRIIAPGRVYRSDAVDATHSPIFHQIEGLVVDRGITMGNLKGCLEEFIRQLYGEDVKTRFRPHHFQFTEPSAEMDIACPKCEGKGCSVCKGEGWIEILGAGMVHRDVLLRCDINPDEYSGFAFGLGLERIAMRRFRINDLRLFHENDVRFLHQF